MTLSGSIFEVFIPEQKPSRMASSEVQSLKSAIWTQIAVERKS